RAAQQLRELGDAEDARGSPGAQHRLRIIMDQRDPRCTAERRGPLAASSPPASAVPASDERLEDLPALEQLERVVELRVGAELAFLDRKSTRLNSSHVSISYAVFCLK